MVNIAWVWIKANKKLVVIILAFLLVFGYILYNTLTIAGLRSDLVTAQSSLQAATERVNVLETGYTDLVKRTNQMQLDLNRYFFINKENEAKYQQSLDLLNALRNREDQVTSDPVSLARDIKAEVEDFENQYSCLVGNLESCSQLP
ncbi:hypothetical protein DS691_21370 [Salmonella enterica subsp. enterica serovar Bareilly]|nr:hypothetical protein [Salmonella enterica subsp. enterica serovar Bareilly]